MEEKELRQLAIDISENKVFGTFHMNKYEINNVSMVFMVLIFMTKEQRQEMVDNKVVHLYEYYSEAGPRSVNGMPCFFSVRQIIENDWKKIVKYINEYQIKMKSFLNKTEKKIEEQEPTLFDNKKD